MPPRLANFVFLVETGFLHVGQAVLEPLTSGDPPASTFQSVEITGMSYRAQLIPTFLEMHMAAPFLPKPSGGRGPIPFP